jgi:ABC-type sugar transport system ATPase subunit
MIASTPIIEFSNVTFSLPNGKSLFRNLSEQFSSGRFYLITGPSGSGKSTFLRLINRLENPSDGHILFNGADD